jgi:hypothetical protein
MTSAFRKRFNSDPEGAVHELLAVFRAADGKAVLAAKLLGMTRRQFDRLAKQLGDVVVTIRTTPEQFQAAEQLGFGPPPESIQVSLRMRLSQDRCRRWPARGASGRTRDWSIDPTLRPPTADISQDLFDLNA